MYGVCRVTQIKMEMSSFTHFHSFCERETNVFIMIIWVKVNVIWNNRECVGVGGDESKSIGK